MVKARKSADNKLGSHLWLFDKNLKNQTRLPRSLLYTESKLKSTRSIRKREKWEGDIGIWALSRMCCLGPECIPAYNRGWFNKDLLKEKVRRRVQEGDEGRERETVRQTDGQDLSLRGTPGCWCWRWKEATCPWSCKWGKKRLCSGFYSNLLTSVIFLP